MLRNNIAGTLSQIGLNAVQPAHVVDHNNGNMAQDLAKAFSGWDTANKKQAYINALQGGDQGKIDSALASYNPEAYAQVMQAREQRANQLADADTQFARQKELADLAFERQKSLKNIDLSNALALEERKRKLQQMGGENIESISGFTPTGNKKYDDAYLQEIGKKNAQTILAEKDAESMRPALINAMIRADKAAKSGNGVGFIGGHAADFGINPTAKAGQNYADIQSANTQMNTYLRKQLAATGLTGSELNSAVEAEAYRYQIKPTDDEDIIQRKLKNFAEDKLGGTVFNTQSGQVVSTHDLGVGSTQQFSNGFSVTRIK